MSSGSSGRGSLLPLKNVAISSIGRQLHFRQPLTLATEVPIDAVVISQLKQNLPFFRAIELTSLNERFALTAFEKRTVELMLSIPIGNETLVSVRMWDEKRNVAQHYKYRQQTMPIEGFGDFLKNIVAKGVIRTLNITVSEALLKALLAVENLSATRLNLGEDFQREECAQSLLPLVDRLASKVQQMTLDECRETTANGPQFVQCLQKFSNLQRLDVNMLCLSHSSHDWDWLANAIKASRGQLKKLIVSKAVFFSPVVADHLATVAPVNEVQLARLFFTDQMIDHVETDLCGQGQCTLTQLALRMPPTGRLKIETHDWECPFIIDDVDDPPVFIGDRLRLGYYLLSLHKMDKLVVVKMWLLMEQHSLDDFFTDLCRFYSPPLMETKTGVEGADRWRYRYRLRVGSVIMYLYHQEHVTTVITEPLTTAALDATAPDQPVTGTDSHLIDDITNELQLQFEAILLAKEREWASKENKLAQQLEKRDYELRLEKRDTALAKQSAQEMAVVMAEYEKTMTQLMTQMEAGKRLGGSSSGAGDAEAVLKERNQLTEDLQSMENAFGGLYRRYEKLRLAAVDLKKNEDTLRQTVDEYKRKLKRSKDKFGQLREHAEDTLEKANQEIERLIKARESDTLALRAKLKQRDARVDSLERTLDAKQQEIQELTSICDELIAKAGVSQSDSELP